MSDIMVTINGKQYSLDEAEKLGLLPKKQEDKGQGNNIIENDIEIIIDEDTKSFRLQVNDGEPVDIPRGLLIDVFEVSGFRGIVNIIEEDGVDDHILEDLARSLKIIN
ncbi:hypothetical protein MF621_004027 (plasmid) [Bacillus velezensis]|uniref:hypothetical protein n=1 Tax=Bacillus velezensis TaxID=492670 RepID=UPI0004A18163|nr:hypothetical protein [Bacillus velezensis]KDN90461.1 hypothetical protein EF87_20890 [Bacillus amyloliquefaciens]URJ76321.1 hypothetical protein MF619_004065 [Bacillus velezensis]URJ80441.1 hypothetical protein MF621_004027 [Bacillus velezensis]